MSSCVHICIFNCTNLSGVQMSRNNSCHSACLCIAVTQENYIRNVLEIFFNFSNRCIFIDFRQ